MPITHNLIERKDERTRGIVLCWYLSLIYFSTIQIYPCRSFSWKSHCQYLNFHWIYSKISVIFGSVFKICILHIFSYSCNLEKHFYIYFSGKYHSFIKKKFNGFKKGRRRYRVSSCFTWYLILCKISNKSMASMNYLDNK